MEGYLNRKIPTERRFELPHNHDARVRLDIFRTMIKEFQEENPEVLGATVYGSMIKGEQARSESDVDSFLYIDKESTEYVENDVDTYRTRFLEKLGIEEEIQSKYYGDLRPQLLSKTIIEREIADQLEFYKKDAAYKEMLNEKYAESSEEQKELLLKQAPGHRTIQFGIAGMFHARVGSGIEKYRKIFLENIATLPNKEESEKIWSAVASQIRTMEQRKDPNIQIDTPDTLEDALRKYDSEFYSKMQEKEDKEKIEDLQKEIFEALDPHTSD